jgi:hypothetical protein
MQVTPYVVGTVGVTTADPPTAPAVSKPDPEHAHEHCGLLLIGAHINVDIGDDCCAFGLSDIDINRTILHAHLDLDERKFLRNPPSSSE